LTPPTALRRGNIVLIAFPFTDLSGVKRRPALIVGRVQTDDLIVPFVTSQIAPGTRSSSYVLDSNDAEFRMSGLKVRSMIRLDRIATLHRRLVTRGLGSIGPRTTAAVEQSLR